MATRLAGTFLEGLRQRLPHCSPNQDQYQDQEQEQKQKPAALRAEMRAVERKDKDHEDLVPTPDARVIRLARDVIQNGPREPSTDYLIDALQDACRQHLKLTVTRAMAIVALTQSQQERTA